MWVIERGSWFVTATMFHASVTQPKDVVRAAMLAYRVAPNFVDDVEMIDRQNPGTSTRVAQVRLSGKNALIDIQSSNERRVTLKTKEKIQTYRLFATASDLTQSTSIARLPGLDEPLSGNPEDLLDYLFLEDTYSVKSPLWDSPSVRWTRKAMEKVDGKPCDVVHASTPSGKFVFWVDQRTHYLRQLSVASIGFHEQVEGPFSTGRSPLSWCLKFHPRSNVRREGASAEFRLPNFTSLSPLEPIHLKATLASLPRVSAPNWVSAKQVLDELPKTYEANLPLRDYAIAVDGHRMEIAVDRNNAYRVLSSSADGKQVVVDWSNGIEARHWSFTQTKDTVRTFESRVEPGIFWLVSSIPVYGELSPFSGYPVWERVTYWPSALPSLHFDSRREIWTDDGQPLRLGDRLKAAKLRLENIDGKAVYHLTQTFDPSEFSWPKLTAYQLWFDANTGLLLRAVRTTKEERSLPSSDVVDMHPVAHARLTARDLTFQPPILDPNGLLDR